MQIINLWLPYFLLLFILDFIIVSFNNLKFLLILIFILHVLILLISFMILFNKNWLKLQNILILFEQLIKLCNCNHIFSSFILIISWIFLIYFLILIYITYIYSCMFNIDLTSLINILLAAISSWLVYQEHNLYQFKLNANIHNINALII